MTTYSTGAWTGRAARPHNRARPQSSPSTGDINGLHFQPDQLGRYWDEITVGEHVRDDRDDGVVITSDMVRQFAAVSGDFNPIHVDPEFARRTVHRRPIAHGMLLASIALGRYHNCGHTYGTTIALLETKIEYVGRAYPGDRVRAEFVVTGKESNPHPKRGRVNFHAWLRNADTDEVLVEIKFSSLVRRKRGACARNLGEKR